jgi:DNA-binding XRE family transcriptional regulator
MPAPKVAGRVGPQDVDRYVGARFRERRILLGLTQQQMAELIGVTFQQAHKYEKGINCVAAGSVSV